MFFVNFAKSSIDKTSITISEEALQGHTGIDQLLETGKSKNFYGCSSVTKFNTEKSIQLENLLNKIAYATANSRSQKIKRDSRSQKSIYKKVQPIESIQHIKNIQRIKKNIQNIKSIQLTKNI